MKPFNSDHLDAHAQSASTFLERLPWRQSYAGMHISCARQCLLVVLYCIANDKLEGMRDKVDSNKIKQRKLNEACITTRFLDIWPVISTLIQQ